MVKRVLVVSAMLCFAASAKAGVVVSLENGSPSGNNWVYDVTLERLGVMKTNDFFVVYDLAGVTSAVWAPEAAVPPSSDWSTAQPLVGPVPTGLLPTDNSGIPNLLVTYTGATDITVPGPDSLLLGKITVTTPITEKGFVDYTSTAGNTDGLLVVSSTPGPAIPEPGTMGMLAAGVAAVVGVGLRRRRQ